MADKDQVEENGKGGDVVDGNSQGGKKGKKGKFLLENHLIMPRSQAKGERRRKERRDSSSAPTSRRS